MTPLSYLNRCAHATHAVARCVGGCAGCSCPGTGSLPRVCAPTAADEEAKMDTWQELIERVALPRTHWRMVMDERQSGNATVTGGVGVDRRAAVVGGAAPVAAAPGV